MTYDDGGTWTQITAADDGETYQVWCSHPGCNGYVITDITDYDQALSMADTHEDRHDAEDLLVEEARRAEHWGNTEWARQNVGLD